MRPAQRFFHASGFAVAGLLMFASVIYDMEFSLDNSKRFLGVSLGLWAFALYHLVRGLYEKHNEHKRQEAVSNR